MRRLLIALVVLTAVAVVGDRIAEHVAKGQGPSKPSTSAQLDDTGGKQR